MANLPEYSSGPWVVDPDNRHPWVVRAPVVNAPPEITVPICETGYRPNAYLIAAAPELFETLKWVRDNYASGSTREINARIDAALAKARTS